MTPEPSVAVVERFWARVDKDGPVSDFALTLGPCWLWIGRSYEMGRGQFYGMAKILGRRRFTHRIAYELIVGAIPAGLELDHLCRVTTCCNPDHLEPVTHSENCRRGKNSALSHLRTRPSAPYGPRIHCVHGHEWTPENVSSSGRCRPCNRVSSASSRKRRAVSATMAP